MFISSEEKKHLFKSVGELSDLTYLNKQHLTELNKRIASLTATVDALKKVAFLPPSDGLKTPAAVREYNKQYYWRKKAERLANGSNEKIHNVKPRRKKAVPEDSPPIEYHFEKKDAQ